MRLLWDERAWEEYLYWQSQDKKTLKRINLVLKDIQRSAFDGIGEPEPLKGNLTGWEGLQPRLAVPVPQDTGPRSLGAAAMPCRGRFTWWSRRIDSANRIVYRPQDDAIIIAQCKGHYDD